jgi:DNA-binding MarR family transcriptional regulator
LALDKSSITGLVDRAERRGLVIRVPSPTDRRSILVSLTDAGHSLISQAATAFQADVATMLDPLPSSDRATLARLISCVLVAHAARQGVDLFATIDTSRGSTTDPNTGDAPTRTRRSSSGR